MATEKNSTGKGEDSGNRGGKDFEIPSPARAPYDPFGSIKRRVRPQETSVESDHNEAPAQTSRMTPVAANDAGRLVVGEGVSIKGEIHSCESLVVWGSVDSEIEAASLDIFEPGIVRGDAKVGTAEILGSFEGRLEVQGRLLIRATGRASGTIRYAELHIEPGGTISGQVESAKPEQVSAPKATKPAEPRSQPALNAPPKAAGAA